MDPLRWGRVESLCNDALEREGPERSAFLATACGGDDSLRHEVEALLDRLERSPAFLERPLIDLPRPAAPPPPPPDLPLPATIGPYRVERLLGRGGMGEVYLAIRSAEDVRQRVALKVIRSGMATDEVVSRFRLERRILATLSHPNIARLLDAAATDDGRPYVVMEYVEGQPIGAYSDGRRLGVRARLELFLVVCAAVQHAHQRLVVHRDLKPRNILVSEDGTPTLLDFGIGKVLEPSDALGPGVETRTEFRLLTPEYAAPEQITGAPVTTATDVYGLGVLLFELLTGRHPYIAGGESLREVERAVLEAPPTRPSITVTRSAGGASPADLSARRDTDPGQLRRRLAGDLDNMLLKALRKEPERRYDTAAAFADDVRRHLDGRPVSARADTIAYRARKFVGRNAAAVAAAAIAGLALIAVTAVTLVQSRRVTAQSARVADERDKALEVRSFLMEMFGASNAEQAVGDTVTARRLLDLQTASLETAYAGRPELQAEMLEVLADGYDRLGLIRTAEPLARRSLEIRRREVGPASRETAASLALLGWITHELGRSGDAEPLLQEAIAIRRALNDGDGLTRPLNDLGVVYNALGRYAEAERILDEALAIRRRTLGDRHRAVGITANNLAAAYYYQAKLPEAVRTQALAVGALGASVGRDHQRSIVALSNLAAFKRSMGDWPGAERDYRDLLDRQTELQGRDHPVTARVLTSMAMAILERARGPDAAALRAEAVALYQEALATFERKLGPTHPQVGIVLIRLAAVELNQGRPRQALALAERGHRILRARLGETNQNTATAVQQLALVRWQLRDADRALALQRQALAAFEGALGPSHPETAKAQATLCNLMLDHDDDPEVALNLCTLAAGALAKAPPGYRANLPPLYLRQAQANLRLGREHAAESLLAVARSAMDSVPAGSRARQRLDSLAAALERGDRDPERPGAAGGPGSTP